MNDLTASRAKLWIGVFLGLTTGFAAGHMTTPATRVDAPSAAATGSLVPAAQATVAQTLSPTEAAEPLGGDGEAAADAPSTTRTSPPPDVVSLSSGARFDSFLQTLRTWGTADPQAALAYACQSLPPGRKDEAVAMLLSAWAKTNPQAAWQWVGVNAPDNHRCVEATLKETGMVDPNSAWQFAAEAARRDPARAQTAYLSALQGMTYAGNYNEAVQFIGGAAEPSATRTSLLTTVASEWGRYEPTGAMAWAQTLPPEAKAQVLDSVIESWAAVDPQAVAGYAAGLSADERTRALNQVANAWTDQTPERVNEMSSWVSQFSGDPGYDSFRFKIATAKSQNVSDSLGWANTITDAELRAQAIASVVETWQRQDPTSAMSFLRNPGNLPPEVQANVLHRLGFDLPARN